MWFFSIFKLFSKFQFSSLHYPRHKLYPARFIMSTRENSKKCFRRSISVPINDRLFSENNTIRQNLRVDVSCPCLHTQYFIFVWGLSPTKYDKSYHDLSRLLYPSLALYQEALCSGQLKSDGTTTNTFCGDDASRNRKSKSNRDSRPFPLTIPPNQIWWKLIYSWLTRLTRARTHLLHCHTNYRPLVYFNSCGKTWLRIGVDKSLQERVAYLCHYHCQLIKDPVWYQAVLVYLNRHHWWVISEHGENEIK